MATLEPTLHAELDILTLFKMSVCQDTDRIGETAAFVGADSEAFQAVVALLPVPFLQACNRHWTPSIAKSWVEGYCRSAVPGRHLPKCEASSGAAISAAAVVAESGRLSVCSAPTAA